MIGNACTDVRECFEPTGGKNENGMSIYQYEFLHGHGYVLSDSDISQIIFIKEFKELAP